MDERISIDGHEFEITLKPRPDGSGWQWILAAPGKLVLSGEAPSAGAARGRARRAGRTLARLAASSRPSSPRVPLRDGGRAWAP